jgi:branched-chain amino acid transport system permease protein
MKPPFLKSLQQPQRQLLYRYILYIGIGLILIVLPPFYPNIFKSLLTEILIYGLFAISYDIVFGYLGLFSLGHAAFFGIGGYATGILITRLGIHSFWAVAPLSMLAAAFLAAIIGLAVIRVSHVYLLLITFGLAESIYVIAQKFYSITGGSGGILNIGYPKIGIPGINFTNPLTFYYFIFVIFAICYFLLQRFVNSPFGQAMQGIRESESRMRALGYNTGFYKYIVFIIGGLFAGISGMLLAYFNGLVVPANLEFATSGLVMFMLIIGGPGKLWGAVIGAAVITIAQYYFSFLSPQRWPLIMGVIFVLSVMYLPGGISFQLRKLLRKVLPHASINS